MQAAQNQHLETIGFGGDGDEVDAVLEVERHFGVSFNYADAATWQTAGDVFDALLKALPPDGRDQENLWSTFTKIMCDETGADASRVGSDTLLIALPLKVVLCRGLERLFRSR
ncbi:hypothetical protein [Emcibacter sp. SYSU 3D8]|uniref:hypothetical protein n=1 Tax=Emcibacter sp. SYSU 3D8 TaxID=3133969 RepID=UPI0031FE7AF6